MYTKHEQCLVKYLTRVVSPATKHVLFYFSTQLKRTSLALFCFRAVAMSGNLDRNPCSFFFRMLKIRLIQFDKINNDASKK